MRKTYFLFTIILSLLLILSAAGGIWLPGVYSQETVNWAVQGLAQDWVDLLLMAPMLVISGVFALRGSIRWFLVWLGLLLANLYSFVIYAFFIHFGILFPVYVAILGLTLYLIIFSILSVDIKAVKKSFDVSWASKLAMVLMIITGVLFYLVWGKDIVSSLFNEGRSTQLIESGLFVNPVHVIDLAVFLPGLIITGILLKRKNGFGYFFAGPLLVALSIISVNIVSISLLFRIKGIASDYGVMPVFVVMALIQLFAAVWYLKQIKLRKES